MSKFISKRYIIDNLLDLDWRRRIGAISDFSRSHRIVPKVEYHEDVGFLYYSQVLIEKNPLIQNELSVLLRHLARELEEMHRIGIVHGDINRKNIIFDGQSLRLIDLEPSLLQRRGGRVTMMATPPYIFSGDWISRIITARTDKIGFIMYCVRLMNGSLRLSCSKIRCNLNSSRTLFGCRHRELEVASASFLDLVDMSDSLVNDLLRSGVLRES